MTSPLLVFFHYCIERLILKTTLIAFKPSLAGEGWVRRNKNNSLLQNSSCNQQLKNKDIILTSPHPTLPSKGGLLKGYAFSLVNTVVLSH